MKQYLSSNKSTVSIIKVPGVEKEIIEREFKNLLSSLGGIKNLIPTSTHRVLIKPNLMMGAVWTTGITVNPYIIELLIQEILREGLEVVVGEGAGWGCNSDEAFKVTGVTEICNRLKVPLIDFKRSKGIRVAVPDGKVLDTVWVNEIVPECDYIISLAKMKTHCETLVSLSLKNMKGLITEDKERLRFHLLDVNRCLIDLNRKFKPDLSIVEGIIALEGIGPLKPGKPKYLGLLIAGRDPVSVDAVCVKIMGKNPTDIRHLTYAQEAGLGTINNDEIEILNENIDSVKNESYEFPPQDIEGLSPYDNIKIVNGSPCSNCIASLASYLYGYIDKNLIKQATSDIFILIGNKAKLNGTGKEIAIGNCLIRYRGKIPFVSGCPPPSDAYLELIIRGLKGNFSVATVNSNTEVVEFKTINKK